MTYGKRNAFVAVFIGYLISMVLSVIFGKFLFYFLIIPGIIVSCNIAREHKFIVSVSVAVLLDITLIILLITSGLYKEKNILLREIWGYASNLIIAAMIGYGYERSVGKK